MSSDVFNRLGPDDIYRNTYVSYKPWTISDTDTGSYEVEVGKILSPYPYDYNNNLIPISSSNVTLSPNGDGTFAEILYYRYEDDLNKRDLREITYQGVSGSYISIPSTIAGLGIKRESISIADRDFTFTDQDGLLIDSGIDTSSFIGLGKHLSFLTANILTGSVGDLVSSSHVSCSINSGIVVSGSYTVGTSYGFNGISNFITVPHSQSLTRNFDEDFTISTMIDIPASQSRADAYSTIVTKKTGSSVRYPFDIVIGDVSASNVLHAGFGFDNTPTVLTSSVLESGSHSIIFSKSGSVSSLYIAGELVASESVATSSIGRTGNKADIQIGSDFENGSSFFSGSIVDFRYLSVGINQAQATSLADTGSDAGFLQTNVVGMVDYGGLIRINSIHPKYDTVLLGDGDKDYSGDAGFVLDFSSSLEIEELKINSNVKASKNNTSLNPSFTRSDSFTSESFSPYITTVGLYDDNYTLVAIGKLSQALRKDNEIDLNIKVQVDI